MASNSSLCATSCPCCGRYSTSLKDLLRHVRLIHFGTPGFRILKCNLDGCRKTFRKYAVFRNHVYEYHANKLEDVAIEEETVIPSINDGTFSDRVEENSEEDPESDAECISQVTSAESMQKASAIWILKIQEVNKLPQSTTEKIMQDTGALYEAAMSNLYADVATKLQEEGVAHDVVRKVGSIFSPTGPHGQLFGGLETPYRQLKYFKEHFQFVVSA